MADSALVKRKTDLAGVVKALDLSENTVRRDVRRGVPHAKRGGKLWFDLREYQDWRSSQKLTGKRGRPSPDDPQDLAAAKLAKLQEEVRIKRAQGDRDERREEIEKRTHQKLEDLRDMLVSLGSILRNGVDRMQRSMGPKAAVEFNSILDEFDDVVRKHVGGVGRTGIDGKSQAAPQPA